LEQNKIIIIIIIIIIMNWGDHVLDKRLRNMDAEIDTKLAECKNKKQWEKI
jgi:hypothetical protein